MDEVLTTGKGFHICVKDALWMKLNKEHKLFSA